MTEAKICLASDNWSPAHPHIMQAVIDANKGYAIPYGGDKWTKEASQCIKDHFQKKCTTFFLPTGTGANVFSFMLACRRYESILVSDIAHVQDQETGATESCVGCKLLTVPHEVGKITPARIKKRLHKERALGKHATSPRMLSLTQSTEVGTVYSLEELSSLSQLCKEEGLLLHIDGSRFYNAAVSLGVSLKEIVDASNVDILSLGGTKNGLMGGESVVIFNEKLAEGSEHVQKQMLQLLSKMRYLSAQYISFFSNNLWFDLAEEANKRARDIATIIESFPQCTISYPVETNQIFFTVPDAYFSKIQEHIFCYPWDEGKKELRFVTSWNTSEEDIKGVRQVFYSFDY